MKKLFLPGLLVILPFFAFPQSTIVKYLSGTDKDHTVQWDFYCTGGRKSGSWTKIPVPSNWELQGFGVYNYGHDKVKADETGIYRTKFLTEAGWRHKQIFLVFEGSMTDTKVTVNGQPAGALHQGSFYRFKYDITSLVKPQGENKLEVTVNKMSANVSVNKAERNGDFWLFGGIYRPVYLQVVPATYIDRVAVNAKADGSFGLDVYAKNLRGGETIEAQVMKLNGEKSGAPLTGKGMGGDTTAVRVTGNFKNPELWSPEFPHLYKVAVTIKNKSSIVHQVTQRFGFRTVELRVHDGLYINGARVMLKGCDRHSFWPETGRTLSHDVHLLDVSLMKEMNMNAVRMSHYPPDADFLDVCDSLGLYVLDELTGWQAAYDTVVGHQLVKEMVLRDVNHPSIIFWDNGNEGGWNRGLDGDYGGYDPQQRVVLHPFERFNGTNTKHYPDYNYMVKSVAEEKDVFFPTEFMHGLYDGGAGAALDDFWGLMMKHPHGAGGFIWAFLDEAVLRTDKDGIYDADGNHAPDGIVGPHREKEASFFTVKEIWSPVYIERRPLGSDFNGKIEVENRYAFTNMRQCRFKWQLVRFPSAEDRSTQPIVQAAGAATAPDLAPGTKGTVDLPLPASWSKNDALYLTAYGPDGKELFTWSWDLRRRGNAAGAGSPAAATVHGAAVSTRESGDTLIIRSDNIEYYFSKSTGYIEKAVKAATPVKGATSISLAEGPVLAGVHTELKQFNYTNEKGECIVQAEYGGEGSLSVKWTFTSGKPAKLEYRYAQQGDVDFMGISFRYPEEKMTDMKWLGQGPYRVWQNRLKGQKLGVWQVNYNNTITGETWGYPEFKGYHGDVNWVKIGSKESSFIVYMDKPRYLQLLHPAREKAALTNNNVEPPFPEGDISFLDAIPAIGTKFQAAKSMGPQSQKTHATGEEIKGVLWFDFGIGRPELSKMKGGRIE